MSKIQEMIDRMCPEGVEFRKLWELTTWDKRFNAVERQKQPKVISYPYLLAKDMEALETENGDVRLLSTGTYIGWTSTELAGDNLCEGEVVTMPWGGTVKGIKYYKGKFVTADNRIATSNNTQLFDNKFFYYWFVSQSETISKFYRGAGIQHPDMSKVLDMDVPLPPLPVQEEIVRVLDIFTELQAELQAELQKRLQQYEYYRDNLLSFNNINRGGQNEVKWLTLSEIGSFTRGRRFVRNDLVEEGYPCIHYGDMYTYYGLSATETKTFINEDLASKLRFAHKNDVVIVGAGENDEDIGIGLAWLGDSAPAVHDACYIFTHKQNPKYISYYLRTHSYHQQIKKYVSSAKISAISAEGIGKAIIPIPPLYVQERIVDVLDKYEKLTTDLTEGLPAEIKARQQQYEYYRDKLLTFKRANV